MPSASNEATQKNKTDVAQRIVFTIDAAIVVSDSSRRLQQTEKFSYGNGAACEPVPPAASIGAAPLLGIMSFWPTLIWSVRSLLAVRNALGVVPVVFAILNSVSPDFTT